MFPFCLRRLRGAALLAALLTFCSFSSAQDGGATGLDDIIELPEFVVQADEGSGYLKTNTISATRLNANVKDLPMPVEVITSDFIKDTGALNIKDAVKFSAGLETEITLQQIGDNTTDNTAFRLRGLVQEAALRNGFRKIGDADSFNITQVDVVRGPNALLYGVGNFGGVVNYITRRPSTEPRYSFSASIDDEGGWRVNADATGPITETVRYSLAALYAEGEAWYDLFESEKIGVAPAVEWQPFKNTTILFDGEFVETTGNRPNNNPFRFTVDPMQPDLTQLNQPLTPVPYSRTGVFPDPSVGFYDFDGEKRFEAANDFRDTDMGFLFNLIQKIGDDLQFQFGYYGSRKERKSQNTSLTFTSLDSLLANPGSEAYLDAIEEFPWLNQPTSPEYEANLDEFGNLLTYGFRENDDTQWRHQFRLEGAYNLPINKWWKNYFIFGITYNEFEIDGATKDLVVDNPDFEPGQPLSNRFDLAPRGARPANDTSPIFFSARPDEFFAIRGLDPLSTKFIEHGAYFIHQGTFWDNRIRTVAGLRYDKSFVKRPQGRSNVTGEFDDDEYDGKESTPSATNLSFGVSMQTSKDSPWAVYFLTAGAVKPEFSRTDARGDVIDPTQGQSQEMGIKYDFLDGKVSGTLAVYNVDREGVVEGGGEEIALAPEGSIFFVESAQRNLLRDDRSRGVDMQTIFTDLPIKNLQTVFNFSYNDYEIVERSGPTYVDDTVGFVDVSAPFNDERRNNGTPPFSIKIWTKYEFKEGPLKGFDVGIGYRWIDEREATRSGNLSDEISFIELDPFDQWDAAIGYKNTFRDIRYNIRLNIFNLTGEDGFYGYSYRSPQGTNGRLTVSLNF